MTIVAHIHQTAESDTPWIIARLLIDEDRCFPVQFYGQFGICLTTEKRARARIGVDAGEVFHLQLGYTSVILQLLGIRQVASHGNAIRGC